MHKGGIPTMRTPIEMPPPHKKVRRRCSGGLCRGLEAGEEGEAAGARVQEAVSCQCCGEWEFHQHIFTGYSLYAWSMLLLNWQGSEWPGNLFLKLIGF